MKEQIIAAYLDWVNNFLSREKFAEHYKLTIKQADQLIAIGKSFHEDQVNEDYSDPQPREDNFRDDVDADADALASAGYGTDEDYGCYGQDDSDYDDD